MKKTTIYILSVLVIVILSLSVILPSHRILKLGAEAFTAGFTQGYNGEEAPDMTPLQIQFSPSAQTMFEPSDSIQFADGRQLPFVIDNVIVMAPKEKVPGWIEILFLVITPIQLILLIIIIWKLLRFILNVPKEKIFVFQNVTYLRQISFSLLAIALLQVICGISYDYVFSKFEFTWPGYELGAYWTFPWGNLLLGFIGLLFAQIWAYGIQIKEDQELTI